MMPLPTARMNSLMPAAYAAFAAVIDFAWPTVVSLLLHSFGRPSVARTMIGGEPAGGGFAANAATA